MNGAFGKVALFGLANIALFAYMGEAITRLTGTGGAPGGAALSGEVSAEAGEALFLGRGKCYTCHAIGGEGSAVRCPNLGVEGEKFTEPVAVRAAARSAAGGPSAVAYLFESLYDPNAFIVAGYPKDLMKPIHRPPIALSDDEMTSVVLYLLEKGGVDLTPETMGEVQAAHERFAAAAPAETVVAGGLALPAGDADDGFDAFAELGCHQCHRVEGVEFDVAVAAAGGVGPDLTSIGAIQTRAYLTESIVTPSTVLVGDPAGAEPGSPTSYQQAAGTSKMPEYQALMTLGQLQDIVEFLSQLEDAETNAETFGG